MNILFIEQLSTITTIGVYDWEKNIKQKLFFDIKIELESLGKVKHYSTDHYINYNDISQTVTTYVEKKCFALIESVAQEVAWLLLENFHTSWVYIKVSKPCAVARAANVGVVFEYQKK